MSNKKLTAEEIIERLKDAFEDTEDGISNYAFGWFRTSKYFDSELYEDLSYKEKEDKAMELLGLGPIEEMEQVGGEGQGDLWYVVYHFVDHGVYIKTRGSYSSYNGTDFYEGWGSEVKPTLKTITVFE